MYFFVWRWRAIYISNIIFFCIETKMVRLLLFGQTEKIPLGNCARVVRSGRMMRENVMSFIIGFLDQTHTLSTYYIVRMCVVRKVHPNQSYTNSLWINLKYLLSISDVTLQKKKTIFILIWPHFHCAVYCTISQYKSFFEQSLKVL